MTPDPLTLTPDPQWITPREAADRVQVSYYTVLRAIKRGDLEAFVIASRLRISPEAFERWARSTPAQRVPVTLPVKPARRRTGDHRSQRSGFRAQLRAVEDQ